MALFRADLTDASLARVDDDCMVIDLWHPGRGAAAGPPAVATNKTWPTGALLGVGTMPWRRRWWHSRFGGSFLRELVLVVVLLLLYKYGRFLDQGPRRDRAAQRAAT